MSLNVRELQPGAELPSLTKEMTIEKMKTPVWSAGNPVHFDPEFAQSVGLPGPIATGEMSTCFLSELLAAVFGPAWFQHSRLTSRYLAPVYAGERLTVRGEISEREESGGALRYGVEVWCENQAGQKVTAGTAEVWLER